VGEWPTTREELIEEQLRLAAADPESWHLEPNARIGGVFSCFARGGTGPGNAGDPAWAASSARRSWGGGIDDAVEAGP
jgi:deoxyribonuclease V